MNKKPKNGTAKEQVSISGTVLQEGFLVASDTDTSENLVTGNTISGNLTVTCNGDIVAPFLSNKVKVIAWQETQVSFHLTRLDYFLSVVQFLKF